MKMLRTYHDPDHASTELSSSLGSSGASTERSNSWITDRNGNAIQYMHYLPYGEEWIDQKNTSWNTPYTFTGKIKDSETGYNYFGARYYESGLSVWLSVDPLSDKYPSLSPYTYCANNPVMMVDPDGMRVNLYGPCIQLAIDGLNKFTNLGLHNDDGVLDRSNKGNGSTLIDMILIKMIDSPSLVFDIYCGDSGNIKDLIPDSPIEKSDAGSFLGDEVTCNDKGEVSNVKATQFINVMKANEYDSDLQRTVGSMVLHEFVEAFCGAMISQLNGESTVTDGSSENPVYKAAHWMANSIMCGSTKPIEKEVVSYRFGRNNYPPYSYSLETVITNVYDGKQSACVNGDYSTKIPKSFYK